MDLFEAMQTFVRVVDLGSLTGAAERLNLAKSAVSRRLTELRPTWECSCCSERLGESA